MKRKLLLNAMFAASLVVTTVFTSQIAVAESGKSDDKELPRVTLFKNVNIFDGKSESLKKGHDVLVVGNMIKKIAQDIPSKGTY